MAWITARKALIPATVCAWAAVAFTAVHLFDYQIGFDFYQFWGIPLAHPQLAGANPYAFADAYAAFLNALSADSQSARLHFANSFRRNLQPLGTPFFYPWFAALPRSYDAAFALFAALQHAAVAAAIVLLARARGMALVPALLAAALVELTFNPFVQDVKVGNVNAFQLLAFVAMIRLCTLNLARASARMDLALGAIAAALLAFKPNTPWIALALAVHIAAARGVRGLAWATAGGIVAGIVAFGIGIAYFGGGAWTDWLAYARHMEGAGTLSGGNVSLAVLVAHGSGSMAMAKAVALLVALFAAAALAVASAMGSRRDVVAATLREAARDPAFVLSGAIVLTFATYPLVWPHYHLWALVPIVWLFRRTPGWDAGTLAIVASYAAFSRPVLQLLSEAGATQAIPPLVLLAWVPLVVPLLLELMRKRGGAEAAVVGRAAVAR